MDRDNQLVKTEYLLKSLYSAGLQNSSDVYRIQKQIYLAQLNSTSKGRASKYQQKDIHKILPELQELFVHLGERLKKTGNPPSGWFSY